MIALMQVDFNEDSDSSDCDYNDVDDDSDVDDNAHKDDYYSIIIFVKIVNEASRVCLV